MLCSYVRPVGGLVVKASQILVSWSVWQWIDLWHWLMVSVYHSSDWKCQQEQWCRQSHSDRRKKVWFSVSMVAQPLVWLVLSWKSRYRRKLPLMRTAGCRSGSCCIKLAWLYTHLPACRGQMSLVEFAHRYPLAFKSVLASTHPYWLLEVYGIVSPNFISDTHNPMFCIVLYQIVFSHCSL